MTSQELQFRLIDFAVRVIESVNQLKPCAASAYVGGQLLRSGTSPALHYGEVLAAESKRDFVHKLKVVLKELRESWAALVIIERADLARSAKDAEALRDECNQLVSIFTKSTHTASGKIVNRKS